MSVKGFIINGQPVQYDYNGLANKPTIPEQTVIDTTLSVAGNAADAKATGDKLENIANGVGYLFDYSESPLIDGFDKFYQGEWEQGFILNGNNLARSYAIRTKEPVSVDGNLTMVKHNASLQFFIVTYNSDGTYVSSSSNIANQTYNFTPDSTKKYRFVIRMTDTTRTLSVLDGVYGYRFYNDNDAHRNKDYWDLKQVRIDSTGKPQFITWSSVALKIIFDSGTKINAVGFNGLKAEISYTFSEKTEYLLSANNVLVWDIKTNQIQLISTNLDSNYLVLAYFAYGKFEYGALYPYYVAQKKPLITDNYPPYYDDNNYMSAKINTIRNNEKIIGTHGDEFIFVTDTHWGRNRKKSPSLVRSLLNQSQINKVFHGGDVPSAYQTEADMYEAVRGDTEAWRYAVGDYLYRVIGNHDIHATDNTDSTNPVYTELSADEVYGLLVKEQENRVHYNQDSLVGMYFYVDNPIQKIRYICLNNFETPNSPSMSNTQITWVANRILELNGSWSIVFIGHCSIIQNHNIDYSHYADIRGLISAIANKTTFTTSYSETFDFSDISATVVGYFAGHKHADMINTVDNVTYVLTTSDALFQDDGYNREMNTINEQAFDVIQIDTLNRQVFLTRIGAGSNRSFTY